MSSIDSAERPFYRAEDVFDGWALQCFDEEHALGAETCQRFISELLPALVVRAQSRAPEGSRNVDTFSVLELGCASGHALRLLASLNGCVRAEGMDCSPRMLWKAKHYFADKTSANVKYHRAADLLEFHPKFTLLDGDSNLLDDSGSDSDADDGVDTKREPWHRVDVVFSYATLYYVRPLERLTPAIVRRWVRPGGLFVAGTDFFSENATHCGHWSSMLNLPMDLRSMAEWQSFFEQGLKLVDVGQKRLEYSRKTDGDFGTIFTWGFIPLTENTSDR